MNIAYPLAKDTVIGAGGSVVVTKEDRDYVVAGMRNITTNTEIQSSDVRVVGAHTIQDKPNGAKPTGTGNTYYDTNLWTDTVLRYIQMGVIPEFDIQITNSDSASVALGFQTMAYYGCHLTSTVPLFVLDSEEATLNYDFSFAYTRAARFQASNDPAQLGNQRRTDMSKLSVFLHPVIISEEKEVVISNRLQDESDQPVPFKIRALTQEENSTITQQATRRQREGGQTIEQLDSVDPTHRMVAAVTVGPDFSSKELCDGCGVLDPLLVPGKLLLSGEHARLVKEIAKLSGFAEQEDEVKSQWTGPARARRCWWHTIVS